MNLPLLRKPAALARDARLLVAVSGGADSLALLHLLQASGLTPLLALHVDHGLSAESLCWAQRCVEVCAALQLPVQVLRVSVDRSRGDGLEAAAREARYAALAAQLLPGDCLVTAHHRGDQAETVLANLFRGSGPRGLAAMRGLMPFAGGWLWRPLLGLPRAELAAYAEQQALQPCADPMNADPRFLRAWLRQTVVPLIETRFPSLGGALQRQAELAAEQQAVLAELADADAPVAADGALDCQALLGLPPARARNALRHWLLRQGYPMPSAAQLSRVVNEVIAAAADGSPHLRLRRYEIRRYRDRLHAMAVLPPVSSDWNARWSGQSRLSLPQGCGYLCAPHAPPSPLEVRLPSGGERLRPRGSLHRRALRILFQEAGVPPWVRRRTPLILLDGELAAVLGVGHTERFAQWCADNDWNLQWESAPVGARVEGSARLT